MSQQVYVGTVGQVQAGLYGGVTPVTYEEGGTNGFGTRMTAVVQYYNWFTQAFQSNDTNYFNSGHLLSVSVSNLTKVTGAFTFKQMATGAYDTDIDAMFDRIYAYNFDSNVTALSRSVGTTNTSPNLTGTFTQADVNATITGTGIPGGTTIISQTGTAAVMSANATATGSPTASIVQGITQPYVHLTLQHEVDRGAANGKLYGTDTPADFVNAWIHLWNRGQARATANGKPASRVHYHWCVTQWGFVVNRITPYYPGNQYVDTIGIDPYTGPSANPQTFTQLMQLPLAFVRTKGKTVCIREISNIETDSAAVQNWWADVATQVNASDVKYEFIAPWPAPAGRYANYYQYNFNKLAAADTGGNANPLKHAGIATMIANLGNNPIRTAVSQAKPSVPTGLAVSLGSNGTTATLTWAAAPAGDNITGWSPAVGLASAGAVTSTGTIAASPRSYTFTNLTPGTNYLANVQGINSAGTGPYAANVPFTTSNPGPVNHAPNIATFTAVPEASNPLAVDYNITATDPDSNPITITVTTTSAVLGFSETFTMTSGVQTTRTYVSAGSYNTTASVSDGTLVTNATTSFGIVATTTTPGQGWDVTGLQPGTDPRGVAKTMLPVVLSLDNSVTALQQQFLSPWNQIHGLVGSTFDPALLATGSFQNGGSGWLIWSALRLESTQFSGLVTLMNVAQSGTGVHVGIHDAIGNVLVDDVGTIADFSGTAVDAWLTNGGVGSSPVNLTLPSPVVNRTYGEVLYVSVYFPTLTTYPTLWVATGPPQAGRVNLPTQHRYGRSTGATGIPSVIPFASDVGAEPIFFGLTP